VRDREQMGSGADPIPIAQQPTASRVYALSWDLQPSGSQRSPTENLLGVTIDADPICASRPTIVARRARRAH